MIYSLNDMALCLGFTIGPLGGAVLQASFGAGSSNTDEQSFRYTALCMGCVCIAVIPLVVMYLQPVIDKTKAANNNNMQEDHKVHDFTRRISLGHNAASPKVTIAEFR